LRDLLLRAHVEVGVGAARDAVALPQQRVHLVLRLRGGAKKRKKKTYNVRWMVIACCCQLVTSIVVTRLQTPKKIKHKRKKVKMSILKYYKVDSDGKIKRLRRECPTAECGAGVFVSPIFHRALFQFLIAGIPLPQMAFHNDRQYCGKCGLTYTFQPGTKPPVV